MRIWLAMLLMLAVALAGCSGDDGDDGGETGTETDTGTGTDPVTGTTTGTGTGGGDDEFEPIEQTLSVNLVCIQCSLYGGPEPSVSWTSGVAGTDAAWMEVTEDMIGRKFTADSTSGDPDVAFMSACDVTASYVDGAMEVGPESGRIPSGTGCLVAWEFNGPMSDITIKIS